MKAHSLALFIALLGGLISSSAFGQSVENVNQLVVVGTASVTQKADQVSFQLTIVGTGQTLAASVESARSKLSEVIKLLKELGFSEDDLTTSHFSEGANAEKLVFSSKKDYKAAFVIQVKSFKIELIETALLGLNQLKIDVDDIRYGLKDDFELTKRAIQQAAVKAREKAEILAKELNAKIDKVLLIEELGIGNVSNVNIRGGRSHETGTYVEGSQQNRLLIGVSNTLFFEENISRSASMRVIFSLSK